MAARLRRATSFSLLPLFAHQSKLGNFPRSELPFLARDPTGFRAPTAMFKQLPPGHGFHPQARASDIEVARGADAPK